MPIDDRQRAERERRHAVRDAAARDVIPEGPYCYTPKGMTTGENGLPRMQIDLCPFWKRRGDWRPGQQGYCRFLKVGDQTSGLDSTGRPRATFLLFDQVKECGINPGDDDLA